MTNIARTMFDLGRFWHLLIGAGPAVVILMLTVGGSAIWAAAPGDGPVAPTPDAVKPRRELYVPYSDLHILLEDQPRRVMLPRKQFEEMIRQAEQTTRAVAPYSALPVAADYEGQVEDRRAVFRCTLTIDALHAGVQLVPLDLGGVGLKTATSGGRPALLGRLPDGRVALAVEGPKRHVVELDVTVPFETTSAHQVLRFRLPRPPATRMRLAVPGDVELKSGAAVVSRRVDPQAGCTHFELIPPAADCNLLFTLNSRLKQSESVLTASGVYLHEVTQGYERIHATVSFRVLYRAVDRLRLTVPEGFEVQEVTSPQLTRWEVVGEGNQRVLEVRLREQTTEPIVLHATAIRSPFSPAEWTASRWEPLDTIAHSAVIGLLLEDGLEVSTLSASELTPIDVETLHAAMPAGLLKSDPGMPALRPIAAWYAAPAQYRLSGRFAKPRGMLAVRSNVLLVLDEVQCEVVGGFTIVPRRERLFGIDFSVPIDWTVQSVAGPNDRPLEFEYFPSPEGNGRIHVRLPEGVAPDSAYSLHFRAVSVPKGWLDRWKEQTAVFPRFAIIAPRGTERAVEIDDVGAIAVETRGDLIVRPDVVENLLPLDQPQRAHYGLETVREGLAYHYDNAIYRAHFTVVRAQPRIAARTIAFYHIRPRILGVHGELIFNVEEARTRRLRFSLPKDAPALISLSGLDGLEIEEYFASEEATGRHWTVVLKQPRRGMLRLAVDFEQTTASTEKSIILPTLTALDAVYQSGLVAVEADPELRIAVNTDARAVDVGELSEAEHQPGRRLIGAYGFSGLPPVVRVSAERDPMLAVPETLVGQAVLTTRISAEGVSHNEAVYLLRAKSLSLAVELPREADFWSAAVDDTPIKPQRFGSHVLVELPGARRPEREMRIVYALPTASLGVRGTVELPVPRLFYGISQPGTIKTSSNDDASASLREVPLTEIIWRVQLPMQYRVSRYDGTLTTLDVSRPRPAALGLGEAVWLLGGGMGGGLMMSASGTAREAAEIAMHRGPWGKHVPQSAIRVDSSESFDVALATREDDMAGVEATADMSNKVPATPVPKTASEIPPDGTRPADKAKELADQQSELMKPGEILPARPTKPRAEPNQAVEEKPQEALNEKKEDKLKKQESDDKGSATENLERRRPDSLTGVRSLRIELAQSGREDHHIEFRGLGGKPHLSLVLSHTGRLQFLGVGLFAGIVLWGVYRIGGSVRQKTMFVFAIAATATLAAAVAADFALVELANWVFHASWALALIYLVYGAIRKLVALFLALRDRLTARWRARTAAAPEGLPPENTPSISTTTLTLLLTTLFFGESSLSCAAENAPPPPVKVPDDVLIVPYEPGADGLPKKAESVLVPYAEYERLREKLAALRAAKELAPPLPYAFGGVEYRTILDSDEGITLNGELEVELYTDRPTEIPLPFSGGVLAAALADGKPARVRIVEPIATLTPSQPVAQQAAAQQRATHEPVPVPMLVYSLSGKGRHRLAIEIRMKVTRQGGWRSFEGVIPSAPATALKITIPKADTEVRLSHVNDRNVYEVQRDGQTITTAVAADGALRIAWRPKAAESQVDRSLTAESQSVFDVEQEGARLTCRLTLRFRRERRERFALRVPSDYLIEAVRGPNVRGWRAEVGPSGDSRATVVDAEPPQPPIERSVEIELLKPAEDSEELTVVLWKAADVDRHRRADWPIPAVAVSDAALQTGTITIRRSPWLDLRTIAARGVARTDSAADATDLADDLVRQRPWALRPYEAYQYSSVPYDLRLSASPIAPQISAVSRSLLKISALQRTLEAKIEIAPKGRPLYAAEIVLPTGFSLERLESPGLSHWSVNSEGERPKLTLFYVQGSSSPVAVVVQGILAREAPPPELPLPQIDVVSATDQQGEIVVQVDPAYTVDVADLHGVEVQPLARAATWLKPAQMSMARLNLAYRHGNYRGVLRLAARAPLVSCETISNVRITGRAVEETVLLDYQILQAGIRAIKFRLPPQMAGCRIRAPMVRQKTLSGEAGQPIEVAIEFQEEMMGRLLVIVENDRLLEPSTVQSAPIPEVVGVRVGRRYITLEASGRDEVEEVEPLRGVELLNRNTAEYRQLVGRLPGRLDRAYLIRGDGLNVQVNFRLKTREAVRSAGARILLAETLLIVDAAGTYRARQVYRIDNQTEPYLEVELPEGATLWTATVANEPVKPSHDPADASGRLARVPLVKTAAGDLDYSVVFTYGGAIGPIRAVEPVRFPLMKVIGLEPESSVVRLCVAKEYRWLRFTGTMRLIEDEKQWAEEYDTYYSKQLESLRQSLVSSDSFARVRAAHSLQLWRMQAAAGDQKHTGAKAAALGEQLSGDLEEATRAVTAEGGDSGLQLDNRAHLNSAFAQQYNQRAKNVVQSVGSNWESIDASPQSTSMGQGRFNVGWFEANKLTATVSAGEAQEADRGDRPNAPAPGATGQVLWTGKGKDQGRAEETSQGGQAADVVKRRLAEIQNSDADGIGPEQSQLQFRAIERQSLQRYQDRLQREQDRQIAQWRATEQEANAAAANRGSAALVEPDVARGGGDQVPPSTGEKSATDQPINAPVAQPQGANQPLLGLASLEPTMPEIDMNRYEVFRFTTPLGRVELVGRAIPREWTATAARLGLVALGLLIAWLVISLALGGAGRWLGTPRGETALIMAGLVMLIFGLLPVAGFIMIVIGAVRKLIRTLRHLFAAQTPAKADSPT